MYASFLPTYLSTESKSETRSGSTIINLHSSDLNDKNEEKEDEKRKSTKSNVWLRSENKIKIKIRYNIFPLFLLFLFYLFKSVQLNSFVYLICPKWITITSINICWLLHRIMFVLVDIQKSQDKTLICLYVLLLYTFCLVLFVSSFIVLYFILANAHTCTTTILIIVLNKMHTWRRTVVYNYAGTCSFVFHKITQKSTQKSPCICSICPSLFPVK